jgi:hypothetical protein
VRTPKVKSKTKYAALQARIQAEMAAAPSSKQLMRNSLFGEGKLVRI